MTNEEFKAARTRMGLSQSELADLLGLTGGARTVRKYETPPGNDDHRPVSGPVQRLMEALEQGWRPRVSTPALTAPLGTGTAVSPRH